MAKEMTVGSLRQALADFRDSDTVRIKVLAGLASWIVEQGPIVGVDWGGPGVVLLDCCNDTDHAFGKLPLAEVVGDDGVVYLVQVGDDVIKIDAGPEGRGQPKVAGAHSAVTPQQRQAAVQGVYCWQKKYLN